MRYDSTEFHISEVPRWAVVIAASSGGPQALAQLIPRLPPQFPAVVIVVQQMRPGFTRALSYQLNQVSRIPVHEPTNGQGLQASRVLIVPSNHRILLENIGDSSNPVYLVEIDDMQYAGMEEFNQRADFIFSNVANQFGKKTIGILLTGTGRDGCEGMASIVKTGGLTIAQDQASSAIHDLPASAIQTGSALEVLPLSQIADKLNDVVVGDADAVAA